LNSALCVVFLRNLRYRIPIPAAPDTNSKTVEGSGTGAGAGGGDGLLGPHPLFRSKLSVPSNSPPSFGNDLMVVAQPAGRGGGNMPGKLPPADPIPSLPVGESASIPNPV